VGALTASDGSLTVGDPRKSARDLSLLFVRRFWLLLNTPQTPQGTTPVPLFALPTYAGYPTGAVLQNSPLMHRAASGLWGGASSQVGSSDRPAYAGILLDTGRSSRTEILLTVFISGRVERGILLVTRNSDQIDNKSNTKGPGSHLHPPFLTPPLINGGWSCLKVGNQGGGECSVYREKCVGKKGWESGSSA